MCTDVHGLMPVLSLVLYACIFKYIIPHTIPLLCRVDHSLLVVC